MQKYVHLVDLVKSFPTNIYLQNLASIQPRTSPSKFARSPCTDPPGSKLAVQLSVLMGARGADARAAKWSVVSVRNE